MILTGRAVAFIGVGALWTLVTRQWLVVIVWAAAVLVIAAIDWLATPTSVKVQSKDLPAVRLSQSTNHLFHLTNGGKRRVTGLLRNSWQPSAGAHNNVHQVDLKPGQTVTVSTPLFPRRRGHLYGHGFTLRSKSLLGLAWRQIRIDDTATLRVLPAFASHRHLPSRLARLRELDGQTSLLVRGEGTEFDSLREYVDGDDVRSLDWRATARHQKLVVRTWRPERDRQVVIMVDTSRLSAVRLGEETRLDANIETSLLLSALALHAGDRVSVIAMDRQIQSHLTHQRGVTAMTDLAYGLSTVEPRLIEPDWPLITRNLTSELRSRALVVLCTAIDPACLTSGMIPAARALAGRNSVVVASASDPGERELHDPRGTMDDIFISAGVSQTQSERLQVARVLNMAGVHVIQAHPDDLAPRVSDRYLALKAAGNL